MGCKDASPTPVSKSLCRFTLLPTVTMERCSLPPPGWITPICCSRQVSDPETGVMGAGAHSDWGLMTLLATVRHKTSR